MQRGAGARSRRAPPSRGSRGRAVWRRRRGAEWSVVRERQRRGHGPGRASCPGGFPGLAAGPGSRPLPAVSEGLRGVLRFAVLRLAPGTGDRIPPVPRVSRSRQLRATQRQRGQKRPLTLLRRFENFEEITCSFVG